MPSVVIEQYYVPFHCAWELVVRWKELVTIHDGEWLSDQSIADKNIVEIKTELVDREHTFRVPDDLLAQGYDKAVQTICTELEAKVPTDVVIEVAKYMLPNKLYSTSPGSPTYFLPSQEPTTKELDIASQAYKLPGMDYVVACPQKGCSGPCTCPLCIETYDATNPTPYIDRLYGIVIHLNDKHKWTREAVADWLDTLHDSGEVNLEFQPWEEPEKNTLDGWKEVGYTIEDK